MNSSSCSSTATQFNLQTTFISLLRRALCLVFFIQTPVFADDNPESPFDGKSFEAWQSLNGDPVSSSWEIVEGVIHLKKGENIERGGNIITKLDFADFELEFDFKNSHKGNSGLKYRVKKYGDYWLGFEYQIFDEKNFSDVPPRGTTGAIYDLYEPNADKNMNPAGEWNHAKIIAKGNELEHWLNGVKIVQATIGSPEWDKRYHESKFNEAEGFGRNPSGRIMLTDHGSEVWIRNVKLKEIVKPKSP